MKNPLSPKAYEERKNPTSHPIRGEFFRDQTAIIHSMPFRRLKHKTQVFFDPENDHVCTRIEHVLHVATIGVAICKGLNNFEWELNSEMAYAIGLGHDLGHSPFGHAGEDALNSKLKSDLKFIHEVNSLRIVDLISNEGKGLNLTYGVRDGIINHNGEVLQQSLKPHNKINKLEKIKDRKSIASSYEGCIVRFADKIAYLGRDIEDALKADFIKKEDIPEKIRTEIGFENGAIIDKLVHDIINTSKESDAIEFSDEMYEKIDILQEFNEKHIYNHPKILNYRKMGENILKELFEYLLDLLNKTGQIYRRYEKKDLEIDKRFGAYLKGYRSVYKKEGFMAKQIVCDYVAGMTDSFALEAYKQIKLPKPIEFPNIA